MGTLEGGRTGLIISFHHDRQQQNTTKDHHTTTTKQTLNTNRSQAQSEIRRSRLEAEELRAENGALRAHTAAVAAQRDEAMVISSELLAGYRAMEAQLAASRDAAARSEARLAALRQEFLDLREALEAASGPIVSGGGGGGGGAAAGGAGVSGGAAVSAAQLALLSRQMARDAERDARRLERLRREQLEGGGEEGDSSSGGSSNGGGGNGGGNGYGQPLV